MNLKLSLSAAILLISSTALDAAAAPACHNAVEIAKQLRVKYDEEPIAFGFQSNGDLLQVWASEAKGTWTIVTTTPAGMSCIVAAGKHWEQLPPTPTDPLA